MRTDNNRFSTKSNREEKTHAEERQQERVEIPEHELLKNLPPFQGLSDICMLLGLVIGAFEFQPLAFRDPDILQNVMKR